MPATEPTLPTAIDYSVAPDAVRTVNVTSGDATSLQTALTNAAFGDHIVVPVATYTGQFTLPVPSGTLAGVGGDNWVTIISANYLSLPAAGTQVSLSDAANMPTIVANTGDFTFYAISCSADAVHHYRFVGIRFTTPASSPGVGGIIYITPASAQPWSTTGMYPHHFSFERCLIDCHYDFGTSTAMTLHGNHMQVLDSYIDEVKRYGDGEAKAIYCGFYSGPIKIHHNYIAGCGSNVFFGDSIESGIPVTTGFQYEQPRDITISRNTFYRKMKWKRDDATYIPQCETAGTGTVSSSGTTVTFSTSQTGLTGKYLKGATSAAVALVSSGSGTSWTVSWKSGTAFSAGESWRYNAGNLTSKNLLEFKAGTRAYINGNTFENLWNDGQYSALVMTPRSFGHLEDFTVTNNKFINCCGPINTSVGDTLGGRGFGPSPSSFVRLRISNNSMENCNAAAMQSLAAYNYSWPLTPTASYYGQMNGYGTGVYTIAAGATTGSGVTFTATGAVFSAYMVGDGTNMQIRYGSGRATITGYTDSSHIVGTITAAFPDTLAHDIVDWYVGKSTVVGTLAFTADSWIVEHNSVVGTSTAHTFLPSAFDLTNFNKGTNFVFRNNLMFHGSNPGTGGGFAVDSGGRLGYNAVNYVYDSATRVWAKNVYFGAQTTSGNNFSQYYTNDLLAGTYTLFHDPDQTGSTSGGSVGFVDYAGGNYRVTGTYATAATDGTMIGVNYDTLQAALDGTTNTPRYLPIRWP